MSRKMEFLDHSSFVKIGYSNQHFFIEKSPFRRFNVMGYFPVLGAFSGVLRIIDGIKPKMHTGTKCFIISRGVCEILGLGILFLLFDLIATLAVYIYSSYLNYKGPSYVINQ